MDIHWFFPTLAIPPTVITSALHEFHGSLFCSFFQFRYFETEQLLGIQDITNIVKYVVDTGIIGKFPEIPRNP